MRHRALYALVMLALAVTVAAAFQLASYRTTDQALRRKLCEQGPDRCVDR